MEDVTLNKVYGAVFGFTVGDALGVPVEFMMRKQLKMNPVIGMREFGTHNQPKGTWSDDSALMFCLMEAICQSDASINLDYEWLADAFLRWLLDGFWTPLGEAFDIGRTTAQSIERFSHKKFAACECGGKEEQDNGNGSVMRVLPLAFLLKNVSATKAFEIIHNVSSITHRHPRAKIACGIYVFTAIGLLNQKSPKGALLWAAGIVQDYYCSKPDYKNELSHFRRILDGEIGSLTEYEIWSSGYVVDSLEASLWSLLTTNTYRTCVLRAINLGEDTDSIAAMAGGLAGLYYPHETIPQIWLSHIKRRQDITDLCNRFYEKLKGMK